MHNNKKFEKKSESVRSPQSVVRSPKSTVCSPQSAVRSPQSAVRSPQSAVRSPQFSVCSPQSAICSLQSTIRRLYFTLTGSLRLQAVQTDTNVTYSIGMRSNALLSPKRRELFCSRTRHWITLASVKQLLIILTFRHFFLGFIQQKAASILVEEKKGTQHAAKLQLSVGTKSRTQFF